MKVKDVVMPKELVDDLTDGKGLSVDNVSGGCPSAEMGPLKERLQPTPQIPSADAKGQAAHFCRH
jgi:hypothetical protein